MKTLKCFTLLAMLSIVSMAQTPTKLSEKQLEQNIARLTPVKLSVSTTHLSAGDKKALAKMIEASKLLDAIYLRQVWSGNAALKAKLETDKSAYGKKLLHYFIQNVGPWSRLDHNAPFIDGVPAVKPPQAGFYPDDMTKAEFETWEKSLSGKELEQAKGFFSVIVRGEGGKLTSVPYRKAYAEWLKPAAKLLHEAASLTDNTSLKKYLSSRAAAFLSDDYYQSDVDWMDLDAPIELTIGPYETYEDELFNYKAAFESFVTLRDDKETAKLVKFSSYLQELENNLPIKEEHKNPKLGALSPIRVVDQVFSAGEAKRGVMTAAFNLPNDEKVVKEKGSKRVMLKNVQEAKFKKILIPISKRVMDAKSQKAVAFEPFFTHILMHELMHGLGPHNIKVDGRETTVRKELKELYSAIEEAKADISGLWALQYLMDKGIVDKRMENSMYLTYLGSCFRSVRFGITEAHGKGIALQFNYLTDEGAIQYDANTGHFSLHADKMKAGVAKLTTEILTLQAEGDHKRAKALLEKYAIVRPEMQRALDDLKSVPVDIETVYP